MRRFLGAFGMGPPAAWMTVTVEPATVSVDVREDVSVFASIVIATLPLPLPLAPDVMVSQEEVSVAVQPHPDVVVTLTLVELAAGPGFNEVGETL